MAEEFSVKDSGKRHNFAGGMVRDTQEGKLDWWRLLIGPMPRRWVDHVTKGAQKYPDVAPGTPNWTLAAGEEEYHRFRASAFRHFIQWWNGERDEDHAAAVFFNINGAEYVRDKGIESRAPQTGPGYEETEPAPTCPPYERKKRF